MDGDATRNAYRQTLDYLYTRLPMFSRIGAAALKPDLGNTLALCAALGQPEEKFRPIHIAGTNGKGSTSHMLAAILQDAGYKTGLYTSPHLVDFRERIRIDGVPVSEEFVVGFVEKHRGVIEAISPSFFEITVAMAFATFAECGVEVAVIETGLGGRLDSTNVITPELSIITNISLDHTDLLGNTIAEIAAEKAGIIKPGVPVVIGRSDEASGPVFREAAGRAGAPIYQAAECWRVTRAVPAGYCASRISYGAPLTIETDLAGSFQEENIATVLTAIDVLNTRDWRVSAESAVPALKDVRKRTGLRGRWEVLSVAPRIIADVAHNPAGLAIVLNDWRRVEAQRKHIVVGFVRDKDVRQALALFPPDATYHFCAADIPRAMPSTELEAIARECGLAGRVYASVAEALASARGELEPEDALLITGSFFIVGEALQAMEGQD